MRKKEKNIIELGEEFAENKKIEQGYYTEFKELYDCYGKCSDAKIRIFNYYKNLLEKNTDDVIDYGIRSYNSMVIILHAIVEKNGKKLYLVITPTYNWYKEI